MIWIMIVLHGPPLRLAKEREPEYDQSQERRCQSTRNTQAIYRSCHIPGRAHLARASVQEPQALGGWHELGQKCGQGSRSYRVYRKRWHSFEIHLTCYVDCGE